MNNSVIQTQYTDSKTGLNPRRLLGWSEGIAEWEPGALAERIRVAMCRKMLHIR